MLNCYDTQAYVNVRCKDRSIYVNVFTFLDFMWSLGALPDGKLILIIFSTVTSYAIPCISQTIPHSVERNKLEQHS